MSIFKKALDIVSEFHLCFHCLGRMFALLGTHTTNYERGKSILLTMTLENHRVYLSSEKDSEDTALRNLKYLSEKARYEPAQKILEKEGFKSIPNKSKESCYLCNGIFDNIEKYIDEGLKVLKPIDFKNFLVGTRPDPELVNKEDKFKSKFSLLESESFKSHFNREIGRYMALKLKKPSEFRSPEVTLIYTLGIDSFTIEVLTKSLFIYGRYNKFIRGIPQTHWDCKACRGNGCEKCNHTGKQYLISVEELINPEFIKQSKSSASKFHGAGREDIDVRMLGEGRPFVLELIKPINRTLNFAEIEKKTNKTNKKKIKISGLRYATKKEVIELKAQSEHSRKTYRALGQIDSKLTKEEFSLKTRELDDVMIGSVITQRTPMRVSHRRADKYRSKKIFSIESKYLKPNLFEFRIEVQGGTYIKELIHGDNGRTSPSFAEVFGVPMICKELDVIKIFQ